MRAPVQQVFPRAYEYVDGQSGATHMEHLLEFAQDRGVRNEEDLDEQTAAAILRDYHPRAPMTRERFAAAYCPDPTKTLATLHSRSAFPLGLTCSLASPSLPSRTGTFAYPGHVSTTTT